MARRRRKGRGHKSKAIPVLPVIGMAMPAVTAWGSIVHDANGLKYLPQELLYQYTGITKEGQFNAGRALGTVGLVIGTVIAHKIANKTVNKYIRRATGGWVVL